MGKFKEFWHSGWMSKIFMSGFVVVSLFLLSSLLINAVNSKSLVNAQSENEELLKKIEEANHYQEEYEDVKGQLDSKIEEYDNLVTEFNEYKESMAVYEELSEEEAKNQADKEKTEREEREREEKERKEKEEEEKKAKEEEERQAEEEAKAEEERKKEERAKKEEEERLAKEAQGYETGTTFEDLARNPDDYIGEKVKFYGKVLQVMEDDSYIQIRLAVNGDYDSILLAEITEEQLNGSRILEDDEITVMGTSFGLYEYTATLGQQITLPAVIVDQIER